MTILITGGAGFVGSHVATHLLNQGYNVFVLDDFSNSSPQTLSRVTTISNRFLPFQKGDIRDRGLLKTLFSKHKFRAVIHCAGLKSVAESVGKPERYFSVNVEGTRTLIEAMHSAGVRNLIFSSSATVYGTPDILPIAETHPLAPESPYGKTKLQSEIDLKEMCLKDPRWGAISLRYFNPIGAHCTGLLSEAPQGTPNNLMPLLIQAAKGERPSISVYGSEYPTKDGTGVRDYIHVMDLALAHERALKLLLGGKTGWDVFNLGLGAGSSVLEVIRAVEKVSGQIIPYNTLPPRAGDVAELWADTSKAQQMLKWIPRYSLGDMCEHSWKSATHQNALQLSVAS